jgi:hypothetical protein
VCPGTRCRITFSTPAHTSRARTLPRSAPYGERIPHGRADMEKMWRFSSWRSSSCHYCGKYNDADFPAMLQRHHQVLIQGFCTAHIYRWCPSTFFTQEYQTPSARVLSNRHDAEITDPRTPPSLGDLRHLDCLPGICAEPQHQQRPHA